jgi:hypothetical protein
VLDLRDSVVGTLHKLELTGVFGSAAYPFNLVSASKLIDGKFWLSLNGKTDEHLSELPNSSIRIPIIRKDGLSCSSQTIFKTANLNLQRCTAWGSQSG